MKVAAVEAADEGESKGETWVETEGLTLSPMHVEFGYVPVNGSVERTVSVTNTSADTLSGTAWVTDGPFEVVYAPAQWPYSLEPGERATLYLRAVPSVDGQYTGGVVFSTGENITLSCHTETNDEEGSMIRVTPSILQFGYVAAGNTATLDVTVSNIGTGALEGLAVATPPFSIVSGSSYTLAAPLSENDPSSATTLTIQFTPTENGTDPAPVK